MRWGRSLWWWWRRGWHLTESRVLSCGGFVVFVLVVCRVRYGDVLEVLDNGADRVMAVWFWFWLCIEFVRMLFFMLIDV